MGRRRTEPEAAEQLSLGDSAWEEPVGYRLTARARRIVAPASVPELAVVPAPVEDDELGPNDPRRARARALRRSGRSVDEIAEELQVSATHVSDWCGGVSPRRRRPRQVPTPLPRATEVAAVALDATERAAAVGGLAAALADVSAHAVTFSVPELPVAVAIVAWLRALPEADGVRIRVILEAGRDQARDVVAHAWAERLDVPLDHVTVTAWHGAPSTEALRATIRVADPRVASLVAGWRAALVG